MSQTYEKLVNFYQSMDKRIADHISVLDIDLDSMSGKPNE